MGTLRELTVDADAAPAFIADRIERNLVAAIAARGGATLAVSGGKSPIDFFHALSSRQIAWDKVTVTLVDERWVPPTDPDSNERLVADHLLRDAAAAARFVGLKNERPDPSAGQPLCEAAIGALDRPFDVTVLGMGEDGHTASLFPGARELGAGLTTAALTLAVTPPDAAHARMSLSLAALLDSRLILLPLTGPEKLRVYRDALGDGPIEAMPIRAILRQTNVPVEVILSP